jgi:type 1 glutamine amidotransferase
LLGTSLCQTGHADQASCLVYRASRYLRLDQHVPDAAQQTAFETWLQNGGGFVGVHAATDCEYSWSWYGNQLIGNGAWFLSHPAIQAATLIRESEVDPSTAHLPATFSMTDEWYNFRANPRNGSQVLLRGSGAMGADHPISWKRLVGEGRMFYTALGHRPEQYSDARFQQHVLGGLQWAMQTSGVFGSGFE